MEPDSPQLTDGVGADRPPLGTPGNPVPLRYPTPIKHADEEFMRQAREQALAALAAEEAATNRIQAEMAGVSTQTYVMRQRRADPTIAARERLMLKARDFAYRQLAKRHKEEFTVVLQQERIKLGLPPKEPRSRPNARRRDFKPRPETDLRPDMEGSRFDAAAPARDKRLNERTADAGVPEAILLPAGAATQEACRHNGGLKKLPYGIFCLDCGAKIR